MSDSPAPPVSRGSAWKIVATVVLITGAVAFLLTASMKPGMEYYKHVDEVMKYFDEYFARAKSKLHQKSATR
jgi:hypothetical protein